MLNTQVLLDNIKSDLAAQTWTSVDGGGTSSFVAVVTYPNYSQVDGYPYLIILDDPGVTETGSVNILQMDTNIQFNICANYKVTSGSGQDAKRKEAILRVREAYDFLRKYIVVDTTHSTWVTSPTDSRIAGTPTPSFRATDLSVEDESIEELNLFIRRIILPFRDLITI